MRAELTPMVCLRDKESEEPLLRFWRGEQGTREQNLFRRTLWCLCFLET